MHHRHMVLPTRTHAPCARQRSSASAYARKRGTALRHVRIATPGASMGKTGWDGMAKGEGNLGKNDEEAKF